MTTKKRLISLFLSLVMIISIFPITDLSVFAEEDVIEYLTYEINDGKVTITGCDESISGDVVIPETIEGYPVTRIESYAFAWRNEITSITIHSYITYIDEIATGSANLKAFYVDKDNKYYSSDECGVLFNKDKTELIKYPEGRTEPSYRIPDGVQKILSNSINNTDLIQHLEIPATVTEIENLSISARSVEEFVVDKNNACFSSDEYGVLFNKDKTELVKYPSGNSRSEYKIPDTVTVIDSYAFYRALNLITINNSCNLQKIDDCAFAECEKLSDISMPDSVGDIGECAFDGCENLKGIEIPDGIKKIRFCLFQSCASLESITIPGSVEIVESSSFFGCENLSEVIIPDSVKIIRAYAFTDCISLKKVTIPSSVTLIETYALGYTHNPDSMINVKLDDFTIIGASGSAAEMYAKEYGFTFIECTHENSTEYAETPATCTKVGYTAGTQCNVCSKWLSGHQEIQKNLHTDSDKDDICDNCAYVINVFDGDILEYITYEIKDGEVIITGCDKSISGRYRLPAEIEGYPVTEIAWHAFMQCSSLNYVGFPDTLRKIGNGAFWNSGLEAVSIPDSVEIIEDDAFGDCFSLKGIFTGRNITEISSQMLRENYALTDVFIGKKVKKIGFWGFNLSDNIENIYYEGTEEEWKKIVVSDNGNDILKTANIIFNCTEDFYSVCQPEKYDKELQMGYSISLGKVTIGYTSGNIEDVCVIPEIIDGCPVTAISDFAFNFEPDMDSITIPASVNKIDGTFAAQCFGLQNIYVDENNKHFSSVDGNLLNKEKTELLRYAIGNNRQKYTIPDTVTTIKEFAFTRLYTTLKVNIPASVTTIEDYAFYSAHNLYYIDVNENNPAYLSDDGVLFNKDKTILLCYPALRYGAYHWADYVEDGIDTTKEYYIIPDGVKELGIAAFSCSELKSVVIPESVVTIGANVFDECSALESVNIPGSVTSIQECAFRGIAIEEFIIPDGVEYIGDGAFQMNSSLSSVTIPDSVTYIGDSAFSSCEKLKDINMGDSEKKFGIEVFYDTAYYDNADNWENNALYIGKNLIEVNDSTITEYTVKDGTINIAGAAFYWCSNIKQLKLPDSVFLISNYAFAGMSSVEKIDIPSGVTEISDYAFMRCSNLREVNIPESVIKIGDGIFCWSDSIRQINYDGDKAGWNNIEISDVENGWVSYLTINCKKEPVVDEPTTQEPTTQEPTTQEPDVQEPTTQEPTTQKPDVQEPTTQEPTTQEPTTQEPTTQEPTTQEPDVQEPTTQEPTTQEPTTQEPTTQEPTTQEPTTQEPDVQEPTTQEPTTQEPTTQKPDVQEPTTQKPVESTPGDLDGNGKITAADARLALRIAAKLETGTNHQLMFADMNKDGKITAADARKILRISARLE